MEKLIISKEALGESYMKDRFHETGQAVKCLKMAKAAVMSILPDYHEGRADWVADDVNKYGNVQGVECEVVTPDDVADFAYRTWSWNTRVYSIEDRIRDLIKEIRQIEKDMAEHAVCKK